MADVKVFIPQFQFASRVKDGMPNLIKNKSKPDSQLVVPEIVNSQHNILHGV